jgi:hypothetical protein
VLRRLLPYLVALFAPVVIGACSASGIQKQAAKASACPLIGDLDRITSDVQQADVGDPVKFKVALDNAVTRYVGTIARLKKVAPAGLNDDLDKVAAAVQQYRFEEAASDRASLDAFAADQCGRTVAATKSPLPSASTLTTETSVTTATTAPETTTIPVASTTTGNTVEP